MKVEYKRMSKMNAAVLMLCVVLFAIVLSQAVPVKSDDGKRVPQTKSDHCESCSYMSPEEYHDRFVM
jgi:hypothetical protein